MATISTEQWESLEKRRSTAFLIGGLILGVDAALLAVSIHTTTEFPQELGQALVGAGWTAAAVGLLGLYPDLIGRSRRLVQAGTVFAVIGAITYAAMGVTSFGYFAGLLSGELSAVVMFFLPGVFLGTVFGFGAFGIASLRAAGSSRRVGLLLLVLPVTFLFNIGTGIAGFDSLTKVLVVVCVLFLAMLTIGYLLRTGGVSVEHEQIEATSDSSAG
jgi:hypothetical protein